MGEANMTREARLEASVGNQIAARVRRGQPEAIKLASEGLDPLR
jgi:hypothetical protein